MRAAARASAISSIVLVRAASKTSLSAATAFGNAAGHRYRAPQGVLDACDDVVRSDGADANSSICVSDALSIPCRRDDGREPAVGMKHRRGGPERLESAQHHHGIGLLDEVRAVV